MTARALFTGKTNYLVDNPAITLGRFVLDHPINNGSVYNKIVDLICRCISIDTMNESVLYYIDGENGRYA